MAYFSLFSRGLVKRLLSLRSSSLQTISLLSSGSSSSSCSSLPQPHQVPHHEPKVSIRNFCSGPLNVENGQGPAPIDYSSILQEDEFHRLADETINDLQEKFEEYGDIIQDDGFDIDYGNQVLTLKLGSSGSYVMNKQTPNRQIWLSSPVSGPSRFDWDRSSQAWVYRRTKAHLLKLLESEVEQLCGKPINLS